MIKHMTGFQEMVSLGLRRPSYPEPFVENLILEQTQLEITQQLAEEARISLFGSDKLHAVAITD